MSWRLERRLSTRLWGALIAIACASAGNALAQPAEEAPTEEPAEQRELRGDDEPTAPAPPQQAPTPDDEQEQEEAEPPAEDAETRAPTADRATGDESISGSRDAGSSVGDAVRGASDTGTSHLRELRGDDDVTADDGITEEAILSDRGPETSPDDVDPRAPIDEPVEGPEEDDEEEEEGPRRLRSYNRIGPFLMSTERSSLQPTLGVQMQVANEDNGVFDATNLIRRMRFGFRARMLDDRLVARLQLNIWPDALELLDLWIDGYVRDWMSLRVGQMKIPFTQYRTSSFTSTAIVDWSLITRYFGSERQVGGMAYGAIRDRWIWDFGIFGGPNRRASHAVKLTELYGEIPGNASDLANPDSAGSWHPEIAVHLGYHGEGIGIRQLTDPNGGDLRYALDLSVTGDARPVTTEDPVVRLAPEVMLKYEHLAWMGLWYQSWFHPTTGGAGLGPYGLMTQATYRFDTTWEISADYARTWVSEDVRQDSRQRADTLIANAATPEEMTALTDQYAAVGTLLGQQEVIVGLNVYIVGNSLKWQTDLSWLRDYLSYGGLDDYARFRTQLQLSF